MKKIKDLFFHWSHCYHSIHLTTTIQVLKRHFYWKQNHYPRTIKHQNLEIQTKFFVCQVFQSSSNFITMYSLMVFYCCMYPLLLQKVVQCLFVNLQWSNLLHKKMKKTSCLFLFYIGNLRNGLDHICCFVFVCNDGCGNIRSNTWRLSEWKKLGGMQRILDNSELQEQTLVWSTYFRPFLINIYAKAYGGTNPPVTF